MNTQKIRIEKLVHRGYGLGRSEGKVWMVPLTLPGDVVQARMIRDRGGHIEGSVDEVLEDGPGRIQAACPAFGDCGGCHLQHTDYEPQLRLKTDVLRETLSRAGVREFPDPEIIGSRPWSWRYRTEFHADGERLGFFARASRRIVEVEQCPLAASEISELLAPIRGVVKQAAPRGHWSLELVMGADRSIVAVAKGQDGGMRRMADLLVGLDGIDGCLIGVRGKRGFRWTKRGDCLLAHVTTDHSGAEVTIHADARCFSQANEALNAGLVCKVLEYAAPSEGERVLELFSGAGNLSVPLAMSGARLTTVESDRRSFIAAGRNLRLADVPDARLIKDTSARVIKNTIRDGGKFDLVVADPPRPGLKGLTDGLNELGPERMVVCSCEPASLARDLALLTDSGWSVERMALIDMFPQTYHMETVVQLKR
ncbi:MAG: class I SAM-dependent RNA methyltransferase [Deltaproteobacteria bacterium]|nr:class I SAM-dependent RNA methyltransferase [Deltaproteobacteria bacterium]